MLIFRDHLLLPSHSNDDIFRFSHAHAQHYPVFFPVTGLTGRPERKSLSTDVRPFLKRLYHCCICVLSQHFDSFCTSFYKLKAKLNANTLINPFGHFIKLKNPTNEKKTLYINTHCALTVRPTGTGDRPIESFGSTVDVPARQSAPKHSSAKIWRQVGHFWNRPRTSETPWRKSWLRFILILLHRLIKASSPELKTGEPIT